MKVQYELGSGDGGIPGGPADKKGELRMSRQELEGIGFEIKNVVRTS